MQYIDFPQSNTTFTKPADMTDEECGSLKVWKGDIPLPGGQSYPHIISCWEVSDQDLENVMKHRKIWLYITGQGMPPVSIQSENPFGEENPELSVSEG